jgi:hypothetical protein
MRKLAGKGIDRVTYEELAQAGVAGGGLEAAQSLLANPLDFKQVVSLQKQLNAAAGSLGTDTATHQFRRSIAADRSRVTDLERTDRRYAGQQKRVAAHVVNQAAHQVHIHIHGTIVGDKHQLAKHVHKAVVDAKRAGALPKHAFTTS